MHIYAYISLDHLVQEQHVTQLVVLCAVSVLILTQNNSDEQGTVGTQSIGLNSTARFLLMSLPDVQGLQRKISGVVGFLNCCGHNSNFRVVQVEMVQKISRACRPLSRQTSESLYKKAENELLIFVLFPPAPTTLSPSSLTYLFPLGVVMPKSK